MAEEIILTAAGGLNMDDSLVSPPGRENPWVDDLDYRYARNVRIGSSVEDNVGGTENLTSTLEISNYYIWNGTDWVAGSAPGGTNKARGKFEDRDEGTLYWAVWNSGGNHQILKFVKSERKIYELLPWSGLNFDEHKYISICRINTYLIITDKVNPPRLINTSTIYSLKFTLASNFSEYHIAFAKWAPLAPPFVDATQINYVGGNNMLNKGLFQFSYRYIYYNGLNSTWSPPSVFMSIENSSVLINGVTTFRIITPGYVYDYENHTYFQHTSVKFYSSVQFIEFGYRQSTKDSWKTFKREVVSAIAENRFADFSNNGPTAFIPENDIGLYFDSVPFLSGSCEAIDNRPMFGDNVDDLEVSDFRVTNVETYSVPVDGWSGPITTAKGFTGINSTHQSILQNRTEIQKFSFKERGIYKLGIIFQHWTGRTGLVNTTDDWTYLVPADGFLNSAGSENFHALGFKIPNDVIPPDWAVSYQIVRSNCLNIEVFYEGIVNRFVFLGVKNDNFDPGITPQDAQLIVNEYYNAIAQDSINSADLSQRIATYYRSEVQVNTLAEASRIYFDISNWIMSTVAAGTRSGTITASHPSNNIFYSFQKGDRIRFKGSKSAIYTEATLVVFDVEIVDSDGRGVIVNKPVDLVTIQTYGASVTPSSPFNIEIYRNKPYNLGQTVEFFEMGEWYPITNPTTPSRDFEKRDWTWTSPSTVTSTSGSSGTTLGFNFYNKWPIINGDAHWVLKTMYYDFNSTRWNGVISDKVYMQMNQDRNNAVGYWEHNTGRTLVAYKYPPVNIDKPGQIRFGGKFLEDSIFININRFRDEWQNLYPSEYGRIRRLINTSNAQVESVGNILLALGESESWSIYVNRTTLEDISGRTQVSISDKVLGSYNTLLGSQGTLNPESVNNHNGKVVWWNAKKGIWNRYSRDGITDISGEKMGVWFAQLSKLLINTYSTDTPARVLSVYDNYYDEWMTRLDHSDLPSTFREYDSYKCVSFAERPTDKRWKEFYDYAPDFFASLDNEVYSIIGSKIHIHENGNDFGKIYGVAVPSQIEFVAADNPRQVKDWRAVALIATDKWSFERIRGDWRSNGLTIQESRIPLEALEAKEGTFWAEIKRDKNSPNMASETAAVVDGGKMRSYSLRLFLQLDPAVDYLSVLNWLAVTYDLSARNPKK